MFEVKVWKVQEVQVFVGSEEAFRNLQHELLYLIMSKLASSGFDLLSTSCSNRSKLRNGQKSFRPNVRIFLHFLPLAYSTFYETIATFFFSHGCWHASLGT